MDLQALFVQDEELMMILRIIAELGLQDSWLAAGTLRNYVWNVLSGKAGLIQASDLDVVFMMSMCLMLKRWCFSKTFNSAIQPINGKSRTRFICTAIVQIRSLTKMREMLLANIQSVAQPLQQD